MARITTVKFSIGDKVNCGEYESVAPGVEFTVELSEGETPESVAQEMLARVSSLWEQSLCLRLATKLSQHAENGGPPLSPWVTRLYQQLAAKYFGLQ